MKISVILCTYNRCQTLAKALESIAVSRLPEDVEWEVLVVDNNSNDETRAVTEDFCRRYPGRFRYLFEPRQGKSYALNSGIEEAHGDVLAFTDDDVRVDPIWLQNITAALRHGDYAGVGGRILPDRSLKHPRWVAPDSSFSKGPLAVFDLGPEPRPLEEPPIGNNMAYRKCLFARHGGFRTDLGPQPGGVSKNEDTEFGRRMLAAGEKLHYEPSAIIYHPVGDRVRKEYFLAWWFDKGRSNIRERGIPSDVHWLIAGVPLVMVRRLVVWTLRWMVGIEPAWRFSCKLRAWSNAGMIVECYREKRESGRSRHSVAETRPAAGGAKDRDIL
jgi:glycosyltransferase involved in cell wall biosynthesis